eukprot:306323-Chlamydomonas_euryale.AAC.4
MKGYKKYPHGAAQCVPAVAREQLGRGKGGARVWGMNIARAALHGVSHPMVAEGKGRGSVSETVNLLCFQSSSRASTARLNAGSSQKIVPDDAPRDERPAPLPPGRLMPMPLPPPWPPAVLAPPPPPQLPLLPGSSTPSNTSDVDGWWRRRSAADADADVEAHADADAAMAAPPRADGSDAA